MFGGTGRDAGGVPARCDPRADAPATDVLEADVLATDVLEADVLATDVLEADGFLLETPDGPVTGALMNPASPEALGQTLAPVRRHHPS